MSRSSYQRIASFTFGIEEEYSFVDLESRGLAPDTPSQLLSDLESCLGERFCTEYMRSQIEVGTSICTSMHKARSELQTLRRAISELARPHGLGVLAAATHPFSRSRLQLHRNTPRYNQIADKFQGVGRRMVVNGLHVHVAIEDDELRIRLMNDLRPYLPILLALSTSSPFWEGEDTGLRSFRIAINDATPRKGIPQRFTNWADFERTIDVLVRADLIEDATMIWWDLRPSVRFPTLEMRITDVCPRLEDAICLAALYRCLCRHLALARLRDVMQPEMPLLLINENRWRAQRYGTSEGLLDMHDHELEAMDSVVERLLDLISEDAAFFDCAAEVAHARAIVARGTSADWQRKHYRKLLSAGHSHQSALMGVVDGLLRETVTEPLWPDTRLSGPSVVELSAT
jgi:carboxylate-amine ligase